MQVVAKQQDRELCEQFAIDVSMYMYKPHKLVFVDETGSDSCPQTSYHHDVIERILLSKCWIYHIIAFSPPWTV